MHKCKYCGEEYRFVHACFESMPQDFKDRFEKPFKEGLEHGRRLIVIQDKGVLSPDGIGKHLQDYSICAEKYGKHIRQQVQ